MDQDPRDSKAGQIRTAGQFAGAAGIAIGVLVIIGPMLAAFGSTSSGANPFSEGDSSSGGSTIWLMFLSIPLGLAILLVAIRSLTSARSLDAVRSADLKSGKVSMDELLANMRAARAKAQRRMLIGLFSLVGLALVGFVVNATVPAPQGYDATLQGLGQLWSLLMLVASGLTVAALLTFLRNLPVRRS